MRDAGELLDKVYRNNLFLIPLDADANWYRYHHLLSEAVRERMKASSPDRLRRIYEQAALWFARNGYLEDAFRNAFASEDFEFAADLLEDYLLFINDRCEYASGRRWLANLPHDVFMRRTLLRLHDGQILESFHLEDVEAVVRYIESDKTSAFAGYEGHKRQLCEDLFTYFRYVLYYYYRQPAHANEEQLNEAFRMISPENRLFSGYVKILVALSWISQGAPSKAEAALEESSPPIVSSGSPWARALWFRVAATVQRMQGRLLRSEAILNEALEFLKEKNVSETPLRYILYLPMAWIWYHRNDLEKALTYGSGAASYGEHVRFARDIAEGNLLLFLAHLAAGEMKEAEERLQRVRLATQTPGVSDASVSADPWLMRLSGQEGDAHYAQEWSSRTMLSLAKGFSSNMLHECMSSVELLIRRKQYRQADAVLSKLRPLCVDRNLMEAVLDIDIARSAALYGLKDHERAQKIIGKALAFAAAEGYVRPFLNHAPAIFPLLSDMKAMEIAPWQSSHLKTILDACTISEKGLVGSTRRLEEDRNTQLTRREVEILRLMATGKRYDEIAKKTFVSLETVKTHVKHIFEKLDVNSRAQAVRRGQDLRILTDR